jgi:hypothetical protein
MPEIDDLIGEELDERVALEVMGWRRHREYRMVRTTERGDKIPWIPGRHEYTRTWNGAAQVVEELRKAGYPFRLSTAGQNWHAQFQEGSGALGISAPEAICRAALKAVQKTGIPAS